MNSFEHTDKVTPNVSHFVQVWASYTGEAGTRQVLILFMKENHKIE